MSATCAPNSRVDNGYSPLRAPNTDARLVKCLNPATTRVHDTQEDSAVDCMVAYPITEEE